MRPLQHLADSIRRFTEVSRYACLLQPAIAKATNQDIDLEISSYLNMVRMDIKYQLMLPTEFWRKNEHNFPTLSPLAQAALTMPASSTASERLFSYVGMNVNDRRGNLKAGTLEGMLLYSLNDTGDQCRTISAQNEVPRDISDYATLNDQMLNGSISE